jgi:hypothetical protein
VVPRGAPEQFGRAGERHGPAGHRAGGDGGYG